MATTNKWKWFRYLKRIAFWLLILNLSYILLTKWINPPITVVMLSSWVHGYGLNRDYISSEDMGKQCKLAVICAEDQLFPEHNGFDFSAIKKAMKYNNNPKHKKTKGASTISQQTAKNVFLWNGRNWFRKGLEVYHTFLIELIWRKKRILETYLNVAEMGKGVFGIQAAAQHYYHKNASELSRSEAAWIASILPNPKVWDIKHPTSYMQRRHNWIMRQMNNMDDDEEIQKLIQ